MAQVDGWDIAAFKGCDSEGVCVPVPAFEFGLVGAREDMVWLSRVKRREVMMTCGTWYLWCSTSMAVAIDLRSVIGVSDNSLGLGLNHGPTEITKILNSLSFKLIRENEISLPQQ